MGPAQKTVARMFPDIKITRSAAMKLQIGNMWNLVSQSSDAVLAHVFRDSVKRDFTPASPEQENRLGEILAMSDEEASERLKYLLKFWENNLPDKELKESMTKLGVEILQVLRANN
jgi:hypothetical protein